jgi:hypothetical protein
VQDLEQQNTEAPDVKAEIVGLVQDHLRRHIVKSSAECLSGPGRGVFCAPSKVTELDISITIQQEVFGLKTIKLVGKTQPLNPDG